MNVIELTLTGRIPSKKNSRKMCRNPKSGHRFTMPSDNYKEWHAHAEMELFSQYRNKKISEVQEVQMDFYMPDNIRKDLTNTAESIMDLLVDCKIIEDDNWKVIPRILLDARGVDRENPRVVVWIKYKSDKK